MHHNVEVAAHEVAKTLKRPWRIFYSLSPRRRRLFLGDLKARTIVTQSWSAGSDRDARTRRRQYRDYDEYVQHQRSGLAYYDVGEHSSILFSSLRERMQDADFLKGAPSVLCLGARDGTEVRVFRDLGCFALGIDINERPKDPCVLWGDFQSLYFASNSIDVVYTNSMDHAFEIERVAQEIKRVLKPNGVLIVDVAQSEGEGAVGGTYEALWWDSADDVAVTFEASGLTKFKTESFELPYPSKSFYFTKGPETAGSAADDSSSDPDFTPA